MKLHRWEDIRAEAVKEPGFEEAYEQAGRELVAEIVEYHLAELRQLRQLTQVELARQLGISQSGLSAMEKRADVQLSTLRDYVEGLGGRLELTAVFDGDVRVPLVLDSGAAAPAVRTEADVAEDKPAKRTKRPPVVAAKVPVAAKGARSPHRRETPRIATRKELADENRRAQQARSGGRVGLAPGD
jgi:transcriptional regulator with XRE-family HTH domain